MAKYNFFSAIVPAYNEGTRFPHVVSELLKIKNLGELIFVDDGSTDDTITKVEQFRDDSRFRYIKHPTNSGKGAALKNGLNFAKNEIILFLDADLENITAAKIKKIVDPVINDDVDVSRGSFKLARGRVTEIAVKPMMRILFPDMKFDQPITGQVCAKKEFLKKVEFENRWGVDIGILLDAINLGQRVIEVDIGKLEHKERTLDDKSEMAEQVLKVMIEKAGLIRHKYKLVLFTLDNTLIQSRNFELILEKLDLKLNYKVIQDDFASSKITPKIFFEKCASLFEGIEKNKISEICATIPLEPYAKEVIAALKRRQYRVGIISSNFSPIVNAIADRLNVDATDCVDLMEHNGILTGSISEKSQKWLIDDLGDAFKSSLGRIAKKEGIKLSEIIMVAENEKSLPLLRRVGFGIAFRPKNKKLMDAAEKTIKILPELLALME